MHGKSSAASEPFGSRFSLIAAMNSRSSSSMPSIDTSTFDTSILLSLPSGQRDDGAFNLLRHAVFQHRLLAADLGQGEFAALVVELLEAVKAVATIAHHLAGLAHIAELLGQLQQSNLRADDLLFGSHDGGLQSAEAGRAPYIRRQMRFYTCPLLIAQPKQVPAHGPIPQNDESRPMESGLSWLRSRFNEFRNPRLLRSSQPSHFHYFGPSLDLNSYELLQRSR